MKFSLPNAVTTKFARQLLVAEKHSPQLLFVSGMALMGATVVTACKATLKLEGEIDSMHADLNTVVEIAEAKPDEYSERDVKKLQSYIYLRNVARVAKLYAPSIVLGSLAVAALSGSHNILSRRNAGLSAALAATNKAMDNYRERVREEYGDERELEIYRDVRTTSEPVLDDEGRATKSMKKVTTGGGRSPYATWWGKDSTFEWSESPEFNYARLLAAQEWCNLRLRAKGHLFLNDVLDQLGLPRTPAGSQVGWLFNHPEARNEYVDFGVMDTETNKFLDFVQGYTDGIWLDFNVDGEIWRNI